MQALSEHPLILAVSLALLPAVVTWLSARGLARRVDDRSLPERLHSHQQRTGVAIGVAMVAIGVISPGALLWAMPLLFTTVLLVGYPLRRTLFDETWSAGACLSFFHRLIFDSKYWSVGADGVKPLGRSRLGASCASGLDGGALACSVYDGTRTRFFRLAADSGAVMGLGWLDGRFIATGTVVDGWRTGWIGSTAVAIDLLNGRVLRVPRSEGPVGQLAVSGRRLAAIVLDGGSCHLRIYEIDPADGEDGRRAEAAVAGSRRGRS